MDIFADMTAPQMHVLVLMAHGCTFDEIAETMCFSRQTLSRILYRIRQKIGAYCAPEN